MAEPQSTTDKVAPEEAAVKSVISSFGARSNKQWLLLFLSTTGMFTGFISATLLMRFYYSSGGSRRWLCGWVQTAGWPVCGLAMLVLHLRSSRRLPSQAWSLKAMASFTVIGCIIAFDNFLYSWGLSYLPASTAGLLSSSQLAFNSLFALFILRKKISCYIWNSIVLVTSSAVLLGLHSAADKLPNVSRQQTAVGYVMIITSACLYGLILSLTELLFTRLLNTGGVRSTLLVLHVQTCTALVATVVSTLGMVVNRDFSVVRRESGEFKPGPGVYMVVIVCSTIAWQAAFLGTIGVIFISSSLLAGVILTVVIPVGAVFAWLFFGDDFGGLKVMALLLSCWGFVSYVYGGYAEAATIATAAAGTGSIPEKEEHVVSSV